MKALDSTETMTQLTHRVDTVRRTVFALLGAAVLTCAAPVLAQSNTVAKVAERLAVELKRQFGTQEQLDAAVTNFYGVKLTPEKREVARRALSALLFNDAVPTYIANLLVPVYRPDITQKEMAAATIEGIVQMQAKGIARLPGERQAAFVAHIVAMARAVSPSACKAMFLGRLNTTASAALERQYIASLPLGNFEAITSLYKEAAEAELAGYPDARVINQQQAKLAEKVYEAASNKRLRAQVPQDVIQRVKQGADSAAPRDVCAFMTATVEGMVDMTEPYRSWQLTRFAQSMQ